MFQLPSSYAGEPNASLWLGCICVGTISNFPLINVLIFQFTSFYYVSSSNLCMLPCRMHAIFQAHRDVWVVPIVSDGEHKIRVVWFVRGYWQFVSAVSIFIGALLVNTRKVAGYAWTTDMMNPESSEFFFAVITNEMVEYSGIRRRIIW